jgi:hypothetical protein
MLADLVERSLLLGGNVLEIEYKDGKERVTALRGNAGVGIGSMTCEEAKPLFDELKALKRKGIVAIQGADYLLRVREYESFGEWVYRVEITAR